MIIPDILKVRTKPSDSGYNVSDESIDDVPLSYITYIDTKGVLRKEKSWKGWGTHDHPDIDNKPKSGFKLYKTINRTSRWNGGRTVFRIFHPDGLQFEISGANIVEICQTSGGVIDGVIQDECVLAWEGKDLILLPVSSDEYQKYSAQTKALKKGHVKPSDLVVGKFYTNTKGDRMLYLGAFHSLGYQDKNGRHDENGEVVISSHKEHCFTTQKAYDLECDPWFEFLKSPKVYDIEGDVVKLRKFCQPEYILKKYNNFTGTSFHYRFTRILLTQEKISKEAKLELMNDIKDRPSYYGITTSINRRRRFGNFSNDARHVEYSIK